MSGPELVRGWLLRHSSGPAGALHQRPIPPQPEPEIWVHATTGPALVLGSTQPDDVVDQARAEVDGIEVCRRRSGGGVVALSPDDCWIDVILPAGSPLWVDDVGVAAAWLGRVWAQAVAQVVPVGTAAATVHRGRLEGGAAGRLICFASLGPGEVTVDGHKVVGLSQRRTREAARFQCVAIGRWEPTMLQRYVDPHRLDQVGLALPEVRAGLPPGSWPGREAVIEAFCRYLPAPG